MLYRGQEELFCCMYFLFPPDREVQSSSHSRSCSHHSTALNFST